MHYASIPINMLAFKIIIHKKVEKFVTAPNRNVHALTKERSLYIGIVNPKQVILS